VIDQLRSELFKLRTTRTSRVLLGSMAGLTVLVVCLHVFTLPAADLTLAADQPKVFGWGTTMAALFGALVGAIGVTGEFRHGTIRPTMLAAPRRSRTVLAKAAAAAIGGVLAGLLAAGLVAAIGSAGLAVRGIPSTLGTGDVVQLIVGAAVAAAFWAVIGTGVGTLVRGQIAAVGGLCVWLLLLENVLIGTVPSVARYTPGAGAGSIAGQLPGGAATLLVPALGGLLLTAYAAAVGALALAAIERRDLP
jgi:ABC-2 type transport system permease protein